VHGKQRSASNTFFFVQHFCCPIVECSFGDRKKIRNIAADGGVQLVVPKGYIWALQKLPQIDKTNALLLELLGQMPIRRNIKIGQPRAMLPSSHFLDNPSLLQKLQANMVFSGAG
jgi:hypothetical protein